jgi:hypothetical protein
VVWSPEEYKAMKHGYLDEQTTTKKTVCEVTIFMLPMICNKRGRFLIPFIVIT